MTEVAGGMSKFTGVKEHYEDWNRVFTAWEDFKEIRASTSVDRVNEMPTDEEYWEGSKAGVDPAIGNAIQVPLTDVEKKLYMTRRHQRQSCCVMSTRHSTAR